MTAFFTAPNAQWLANGGLPGNRPVPNSPREFLAHRLDGMFAVSLAHARRTDADRTDAPVEALHRVASVTPVHGAAHARAS